MSVKPRPIREGASKSALHVILLCTVAGFLAVSIGIILLAASLTTVERLDLSSAGLVLILLIVLLVLALSLQVMLFVPFAAYLRKKRFKLLSFAGFTNPGAGVGWLSAAAAIFLFAANIALINVFMPLFQLAGMAQLPTREPALPTDQVYIHILAALIQLAILASVPAVLEEFVFRGVLFRTLGASWRTVWVSAILFALMHVDPSTLPSKLAMGFALAAVFFMTRSIWTCVIMHFVNNALAVATQTFLPVTSIQDAAWPLEAGIWAGVALVSAAAFAGLLFAMKKVRLRREDTIRRRTEGASPAEKLGFESIYVEPPLVDSHAPFSSKRRAVHLPLWFAGGILLAANVLAALAGFLHWFGEVK